jgi:hypothetical protein
MRQWRINPGFNEVRLLVAPAAPPAPGARLISGELAADLVDAWFPRHPRSESPSRLADLIRLLFGPLAARERPEALRRRIRSAFASGRLLAFRIPNRLAGEHRPPPEEMELERIHRPRKEELDFIDVLVTNGLEDPWPDEEYILHLPNGEIRTGKLDGDGRLRADDITHGSFSLALPAILDATIFRDGERLPEAGSGRPLPLPSPPSPFGGASSRQASSADDFDDDVDDDDGDDEPVFPAYDIEDRPFDGPPAYGFEPFESEQSPDDFPFFDLTGLTGCKYQLATLHCVSARLLQPDGQWQREPVDYEVVRHGGQSVARGSSENGIIFVDDVAIDPYEVVVAGERYPLRSTPYARHYSIIHLVRVPKG